jgi:hypothetical protein
MKKILISVIFLSLSFLHSYGQYGFSGPFLSKSQGVSRNTNSLSPKISLGLSSTFHTTPFGTSVFGTNIAPSISFQVKPKLQIETGMSYQTYFMNSKSSPQLDGSVSQNANTSTGMIYISGIYELNPKTTIRGTAWKQFDLSDQKSTINPRATNFEAEGFNVGINYKVNDHFQIDASIDYSNGFNPYRSAYNGFGNYGGSSFMGF